MAVPSVCPPGHHGQGRNTPAQPPRNNAPVNDATDSVLRSSENETRIACHRQSCNIGRQQDRTTQWKQEQDRPLSIFFNSQLGTTADSYRNSDFLTSGTRRVTLHRESVSLRKKRKMTDENKKGRAKGYCTRKKRKGRKKTDGNCSTSKFPLRKTYAVQLPERKDTFWQQYVVRLFSK